jgi:hypothetical protein
MLLTVIAIWAVVTVILIALSIHRSIFIMREEDTIFVSTGERSTKSEYAITIQRLKRLESVLKVFSFASGALTLLVAVMWLYERLYR